MSIKILGTIDANISFLSHLIGKAVPIAIFFSDLNPKTLLR
jgi:hypothetical protein